MLVNIVSDDHTVADRIRRLLIQEGLDCRDENVLTFLSAPDRVSKENPDLVVMALGKDIEHGLSVMASLHVQSPTRVLAVGPASDPKLVIHALRSGADDYLDIDDLEKDLREVLPRCRSLNQALHELGRVIVVLAPSGGSGSSTLAANLATSIAQAHKRTVLIDMKLEAGDLSALLDLKPEHTISDLCQRLEGMDQSLFERSLTVHSRGAHLLAAPRNYGDDRYVTVEATRQILGLARAGFSYVVVDLDHTYREEQAEVLRHADTVLLLMRMEFTALRNTKRTLDYLDKVGLNRSAIHLIINRYGQPKEVPADRAEEALGMKIFHYIPDDPKTVNRANNNGVPVVIEDPWTKVAQSINHLAKSIMGC